MQPMRVPVMAHGAFVAHVQPAVAAFVQHGPAWVAAAVRAMAPGNPGLQQHLLSKIAGNSGFADSPVAHSTVVKALTCGFDASNLAVLQATLLGEAEAAGVERQAAARVLAWCRACMQSVGWWQVVGVMQGLHAPVVAAGGASTNQPNQPDAVVAPAPRPGSVAGVWAVLDGQCKREGLEFLQDSEVVAMPAGVVADECAALVQMYWE